MKCICACWCTGAPETSHLCPPYMRTPVDALRLCEDRLFWRELRASLSRAGPGWARPGGGGTERRVFSPEAAALCQAGRVASDAVPRLSAQVVEQQHRLVCFCANSSPTPHPDHCLFCLCVHMLRHSFHTPTYPSFFPDSTAPAFTKLKVTLAFVGWTIIALLYTRGRWGVWHGFKRHNEDLKRLCVVSFPL